MVAAGQARVLGVLADLGGDDDVVAVAAGGEPLADDGLGLAALVARRPRPSRTSAVSTKLPPAAAYASRTAKDWASSAVQPKTLPPRASGKTSRSEEPSLRREVMSTSTTGTERRIPSPWRSRPGPRQTAPTSERWPRTADRCAVGRRTTRGAERRRRPSDGLRPLLAQPRHRVDAVGRRRGGPPGGGAAPVTLPVAPTRPMTSPVATFWPTLTLIEDWWQYQSSVPSSRVEDRAVAVRTGPAGLGDGAAVDRP